MRVPFMDLKARNAPLRSEYLRAMAAVMDSGHFSCGSFVKRFEEEYAAYCGTRHAIAVGSGTEALWLALVAMGIRPGDEVITVPMTFVATVEAILLAGAKPVFVDIDPVTYTMDPGAIAAVLSTRTRVILPVHLFGQAADMGPIMELAREHGLRVIEDAAQAHGAEWNGCRAGSLADAGCFSFYPAKNLGGFGEGGAVTTDDADMAGTLRMLRDHGQSRKHKHELIGWNSRMDELQAAVLGIKLRHLDEDNRIRRHHAQRYAQALAGIDEVTLPVARRGTLHAWHDYALRVRRRSRLLSDFRRHGIGYGLHYPLPVHLQKAYRHLGFPPQSFPLAECCADEFVSLPIGCELDDSQIDEVIGAIERWAVTRPTAGSPDWKQNNSPRHAKI